MTDTEHKEPLVEEPKKELPQTPSKDPVDEALSTLSSLREQLVKKDEEISTLKSESAKKDDKIQKVVEYHHREMARVKAEHEAEISRIKSAIKEAMLNDEE